MFYHRHADETIRTLSKMFGAVLVTGARQVGKTTLLSRLAEGAGYVTLDDAFQRANANTQSATFFKDNPPPVFVIVTKVSSTRRYIFTATATDVK